MGNVIHTCGQATSPLNVRKGAGNRGGGKTIDLHCHALSPATELLVANEPEKQLEGKLNRLFQGEESSRYNAETMLPAIAPKLTDLAQRLADMDAMGVDIQAVSPSPTQYYYWANRDLTEAIVTSVNEGIAQMVRSAPDRLVGLGSVSLQFPDLAARQLEHCVKELGFKGVEISASLPDRELSDPGLDTFWAKAEELGCIVFIHPMGSSLGERLNRHYLSNIVGQPIETTIALSHLIFSGVLDRFSALKILAAHGGGYLPTYSCRSNHAYHVRPDSAAMASPPSDYLKRIWFDSVVYSPKALRDLIDAVGVSQVVIGTDYPFDMGCYNIDDLVDGLPELTEKERIALRGGNAAELLGLKP